MNETTFLPANSAELVDSISAPEYNRFLLMPRSRNLDGELLDRANKAREWYSQNGKPFVASRTFALIDIESPVIRVTNHVELNSIRLAERLKAGEAGSLVVLAASAGPEVAEEVAKCWSDGRPDEAYFLDRLAVAVTEQLIQWSSAYLCRESESRRETLLPHLSPGCGSWDLQDQHKLMDLLAQGKTEIGPIRLMDSGGLHPQHSVMAALGVTRRKFEATPKDICRGCDLDPCAFRRAPYSSM
jgi:hypothetical protein